MCVNSPRGPFGPIRRTTLWFLLAGLCWCVILSLSAPIIIVLFPVLVAMPCLVAYLIYWKILRTDQTRQPSQQADDLFLRISMAGLLPGMLLALLVELVLTAVGVAALAGLMGRERVQQFAERIEEGEDISFSGWYVLAAVFLSFVVAGLTEEVVKVLVVRQACFHGKADRDKAWCKQQLPMRPRTTVALMLAAGLGFALAENVAYTASSAASAGLAFAAFTAVARSLVSLPLHGICAMLTGIVLSELEVERGVKVAEFLDAQAAVFAAHGLNPAPGQPIALPLAAAAQLPAPVPPANSLGTLLWSVGPSVLVHGAFDVVAMLIPFAVMKQGAGVITVVSLVGAVPVLVVAVWYMRKRWRQLLAAEHRHRTQLEQQVAGGRPMLVFIHGGGWKRFNPGLHSNVGHSLASRGLVVVLPGYRKSSMLWWHLVLFDLVISLICAGITLAAGRQDPLSLALAAAVPFLLLAIVQFGIARRDECCRRHPVRWPLHLEDSAAGVAAAVARAAELGADPCRVVVAGHSAGGHIAAMLMLDAAAALWDKHRIAVRGSAAGAWVGQDPAAAGSEARGAVVAAAPLSGVYDMDFLTASTEKRCVYMLPIFGGNEAEWPGSFPLQTLAAWEEGRPDTPGGGRIPPAHRALPPFLLMNAESGRDLGLEPQTKPLEAALRRCGARVTVVPPIKGTNHISFTTSINKAGSIAERRVPTTLARFAFGQASAAAGACAAGAAAAVADPSMVDAVV